MSQFVVTDVRVHRSTAPRPRVTVDVRHMRPRGSQGPVVLIKQLVLFPTREETVAIKDLVYPEPESDMPPLLTLRPADGGYSLVTDDGDLTLSVPATHVREAG